MATSSHAEPVRIVDADQREPPTLFDAADAGDVENHIATCRLDRAVRRFGGAGVVEEFLDGVLERLGKDARAREARLVEDGASLLDSDDVGPAGLFALPDQSLLFVGEDPTATARTFPLFAFVVERGAPVPTPRTAAEALDLLKPGAVRQAIDDRDVVSPQGEWFLVETAKVPVGQTWKPGRSGASPLGNHVPTEFGFAVSEREFVDMFHELVDDAPSTLRTVPEVLEAVRSWDSSTLDRPGYEIIQEAADSVLVRGTLRHRQRDHFSLDAGPRWREALTHDVEVFTADALDAEFRVMLD